MVLFISLYRGWAVDLCEHMFRTGCLKGQRPSKKVDVRGQLKAVVLISESEHDLCCLLLFSCDLHLIPVVRHVFAAIQTDHIGTWFAGNAATVANGLESPGKAVVGVSTTEKNVHQLGEHGELQWNEIDGAYRSPISSATRFCLPRGICHCALNEPPFLYTNASHSCINLHYIFEFASRTCPEAAWPLHPCELSS